MGSRYICVATYSRISIFIMAEIFHCVYVCITSFFSSHLLMGIWIVIRVLSDVFSSYFSSGSFSCRVYWRGSSLTFLQLPLSSPQIHSPSFHCHSHASRAECSVLLWLCRAPCGVLVLHQGWNSDPQQWKSLNYWTARELLRIEIFTPLFSK